MAFSLQLSRNCFCFVCLLLVAFYALPSSANADESLLPTFFAPERIVWRSLSYGANSVLGKVAIKVRIAVLPAEEAADQLITVPQADALQPSGAKVICITVDSNINPLFGSNEILKTQSWFNSNDAAALQLVRLRQGGKIWQKSYRFLPNGVYHQRKKPADKKQLKLPPEQWSTFEKKFYRYISKKFGCPAVLEPDGLLYLVSALDYERLKGPLSLCVFDKQQLHRVTLIAGGIQQLKVNYIERLRDYQIRREGTIEVIKISFQPRLLAPEDQKPEEFSFLGLKGDIDIFIDNTTRIPVWVSGGIGAFGKLDIILQEVEGAHTQQ